MTRRRKHLARKRTVWDTIVYLADSRSRRFRQRVSIQLATRHLRSQYHRDSTDNSGEPDWEASARRHLNLHLSQDGTLIQHCYWTPVFAYPNLADTLFIGVSLMVPIGMLLGPSWLLLYPPLGLIAGLGALITTGSFVVGVAWAFGVTGIACSLLLIYSTVEAIRVMFIPPNHKRLDQWFWRYEFGEVPTIGPYTSVDWHPPRLQGGHTWLRRIRVSSSGSATQPL